MKTSFKKAIVTSAIIAASVTISLVLATYAVASAPTNKSALIADKVDIPAPDIFAPKRCKSSGTYELKINTFCIEGYKFILVIHKESITMSQLFTSTGPVPCIMTSGSI